MTKNITLRLDEPILRTAKKMAFENDTSLSQWVARLISRAVKRKACFQSAKRRAIKRLEKGFNLGGHPLQRGEVYER